MHAYIISLTHSLQAKMILSRKHAHNKYKTVFHSSLSVYLVKTQCKVLSDQLTLKKQSFFPPFYYFKKQDTYEIINIKIKQINKNLVQCYKQLYCR